MKRPPHRHQGIRTEQQKNATTRRQQDGFCFGFYKNKNNVLSIRLHWEWGDSITDICVLIKQIDTATRGICITDDTDF